MQGKLEAVVFDAADIDELAFFYGTLTGWQPVLSESDWITLRLPDGQEVAFQLAPDHIPAQWPGQQQPQQFHLDLLVDGPENAAARAVALGATRLAEGADWITVADPAGHPIDLCHKDGVGPVMGLWAVSIDVPDATALAHFYADILGMEITHDGPDGAAISGEGRTVYFQQVDAYVPPRWPDPARPQQAHLDIRVDDPDAAESRVLSLGAVRLSGGGASFRVYSDPAGHPFCLTT